MPIYTYYPSALLWSEGFFYIISAIASLLNKGGVMFENENGFFENETER